MTLMFQGHVKSKHLRSDKKTTAKVMSKAKIQGKNLCVIIAYFF